MFHDRKWVISDVFSIDDLANKLTQYTWCPCNGFRIPVSALAAGSNDSYLFLNDATSPDGAQEFGVIHEQTMRQVESITFSWCNTDEAVSYIEQALRGEFEPYTDQLDITIESPEKHNLSYCHHCA